MMGNDEAVDGYRGKSREVAGVVDNAMFPSGNVHHLNKVISFSCSVNCPSSFQPSILNMVRFSSEEICHASDLQIV